MSITTKPTAPKHHPNAGGSAADKPSPSGGTDSAAASRLPAPGAVTLFEVPFASAMGDCDLALVARMLDLSTHMHPRMRPGRDALRRRNDRIPTSHDSPGLARLDHYSGLFLKRGVTEGDWTLEARTWGHPPPDSVHEWHVLAAGAAHQLDPTVTFPDRLHATSSEIADRPLGRAANKRLARIRRRLVGLP